MTTEVPCPALDRKIATEGREEAQRKFRTLETSQFFYRILGQFSGYSVDSRNGPLLKTLIAKCSVGFCLVPFWMTNGFLIGVHQESVRYRRSILLVT